MRTVEDMQVELERVRTKLEASERALAEANNQLTENQKRFDHIAGNAMKRLDEWSELTKQLTEAKLDTERMDHLLMCSLNESIKLIRNTGSQKDYLNVIRQKIDKAIAARQSAKPDFANNADYYDALKRITMYDKPERLRSRSGRDYGLSGDEALEMAYENVLNEARIAIKGKRRPVVKTEGEKR